MNKGIIDFPARLASIAVETEALLKQLLGDAPLDGEIFRPTRLIAAMRHAALDGGKRLRPVFCLLACEAVSGQWTAALHAWIASSS